MIDLTPLDVRKKRGDFRRGLRGYETADVDQFMNLVADRLDELVRENLALREANERLTAQVEDQEGRQKAVQEALVTAQELREEIREQSRREADLLLREAEAEAKKLRSEAEEDARALLRRAEESAESLEAEAGEEAERMRTEAERRVDALAEELRELTRRRERFLQSFRSLLKRELDVLEAEAAESEPEPES